MYIVSPEEEKRLQWEGSRICRKGRFYVSQSIRTFLFLRRRLGALAAEVHELNGATASCYCQSVSRVFRKSYDSEYASCVVLSVTGN